MRSISVWYFIKMKTGGIFYFLRRCSRCRITGTLFHARRLPPAARRQSKGWSAFEKCSLHAASFSPDVSNMSALCRGAAQRACSPHPKPPPEIQWRAGVACGEPPKVAEAKPAPSSRKVSRTPRWAASSPHLYHVGFVRGDNLCSHALQIAGGHNRRKVAVKRSSNCRTQSSRL